MLNREQLILLAGKQAKLDEHIRNSKDLSIFTWEELKTKRIIAFIIEVSEFLNEYRDFKYWSNKNPSEKPILLEEYIDGLHFILSIGLILKFEFNNYKQLNKSLYDNLNQLSIEIFKQSTILDSKYDLEQYRFVLDLYLSIAYLLNFSDQDILKAYDLKNQENFNRQNNGY